MQFTTQYSTALANEIFRQSKFIPIRRERRKIYRLIGKVEIVLGKKFLIKCAVKLFQAFNKYGISHRTLISFLFNNYHLIESNIIQPNSSDTNRKQPKATSRNWLARMFAFIYNFITKIQKNEKKPD